MTKEASFTGFDEKGFCGSVFKTHGTCCDQKDLFARAKAWKQRLQARFSKLNGGMNKFVQILDKKKDNLEKMLEKKNKDEEKKPKEENKTEAKPVVAEAKPAESTDTKPAVVTTKPAESTDTKPAAVTPKPEPTKRILTNTVTPGFNAASNGTSVTPTPVKNTSTATTTTPTKTHTTGTSTHSHTSTSTHTHGKSTGSTSEHKDKKTEKRNHIFKKAKESFKQCFKALMTMRYNGLCLRCSGAAVSAYNEATGSYKVRENVCPEAITACSPLYAILSEAQNTYVRLAKIKAKLEKKFARLANFAEPSEAVVSEWSQCAQDTDACIKNTSLLTSLCQKLTITKQSAENGENPEVLDDADMITEASAVTTRLLSETSTSGEGHLIVDSSAKVDLNSGFVSGATEAEASFEGNLNNAMIGSVVAVVMMMASLF